MLTRKNITFLFVFYILSIIVFVFLNLKKNNIILDDVFILQLRLDYLLHLVIFLPWAIFIFLLHKKSVHWFIAGLIFAALTESLQLFIVYRSFNINDLIANCIGIVSGHLLLRIFRKVFSEIRQKIK